MPLRRSLAISLVLLATVFSGAKADDDATLDRLTKAIEANPTEPRVYSARAQYFSTLGKHDVAIADFDKAIELMPLGNAGLVDFRGSERLLAGQFKEAIADFDTFLAAHPDQAPYHWKRGIALYYAGRYDGGRKQFDIHQTVNSADVENAVWRYLCMARDVGVEKAQADLLKIGPDSRVPMAQVYELYAGKKTIDDVLAAAKAGNPSDAELRVRLFYAHLYIGLHFDAAGDSKQALEHMKLAVDKYLVDHYMGGIAVVHLNLLEKPQK